MEAANYDKFYSGAVAYTQVPPLEGRNECTMTQEEVKEKAVQICEDLGMPEMQAVGIWEVKWFLKEGSSSETVCNGYWIRLFRTIGGVAVESRTYQDAEADEIYLDTEKQKRPYEQEVVEIGITDNGIIGMSYEGILFEERTVKDIKLLDFENIKEIFKNELKEKNTDENFKSLKLVYAKVKGEEQSGAYSYLPVWQLSTQPEGSVNNEYFGGAIFEYIFVNGIDGNQSDMKENEMLLYIYPDDIMRNYYNGYR